MDLIWRDSGLTKKKVVLKPNFKCSTGFFGSSTNDFELTLPITDKIPIGDFITYGSTEYGGCVRERITSTEDKTIKYIGKSFRGQLENSIINPFSVLTLSGTIDDIVGQIINLSVVDYEIDYSGISHTKSVILPKSTNALKAIDLVMSAFDAKFKLIINKNKVHMIINSANLYKHDASQTSLVVDENQMLPTALHAYNDKYSASVYLQADGSVGTTRYYTGFSAKEISESVSADSESDLQKLASDKLIALRTSVVSSEILLDLSDEEIGDKIDVSVKKYGIKATQTVTEKTLEIQGNNKEFIFNTGG